MVKISIRMKQTGPHVLTSQTCWIKDSRIIIRLRFRLLVQSSDWSVKFPASTRVITNLYESRNTIPECTVRYNRWNFDRFGQRWVFMIMTVSRNRTSRVIMPKKTKIYVFNLPKGCRRGRWYGNYCTLLGKDIRKWFIS